MSSKFFIISGIQGDYRDISNNMINSILFSDLIFVEEISQFELFLQENKMNFKGEVVKLSSPFNVGAFKEKIFEYLNANKNIGIFESSGTACFIDPGFELVSYMYELKNNSDIEFIPIPGTSALTLAISLSGFKIVKFNFMGFLGDLIKNEVLDSDVPMIYFNDKLKTQSIIKLLEFMKDIDSRQAFIGINLGKVGIKTSNKLIRGKYSEVYLEFCKLYKYEDVFEDITFIFK